MDTKNNQLTITNECEIVDVLLSLEKTPIAYGRKLRELVEQGMTEEEAKEFLLRPIPLELYYEYCLGLFAVESEAVDSIEIYSPYTGKEIPKENK